MKKLSLLGVVGAIGLLAGCSSAWDIEGVKSAPNAGNAFTKALQQRYSERATFEKGEGDWRSVAFFVERARMSSEGKAPMVQDPTERGLTGNAGVVAARGNLTAALATSAPTDNPDACALAQTWFEHWMEQLEEGHQPNDIAEAKTGFDSAMPKCVSKAMAQPMPPAPKTFVVFFDFNKADLSAEARKTLADVAKAAGKAGVAVTLTGHTDTSGKSDYNERLAAKRVKAVADALTKLGVKAAALSVSSLGEAKPAKATGDNVKEMTNRRVEILVK